MASLTRIVIVAAAFIGLFVGVKPVNYHHAPAGAWAAFAVITLFGGILNLSSIGINVAIERDWITAISKTHQKGTLTTLNAYMRRIDLLTKLLAPLFTSLLTTAASYTFATAFLMGFAGVTFLFEIFWIQVVYKSFPSLLETDRGVSTDVQDANTSPSLSTEPTSIKYKAFSTLRDWMEFSKMPVFASSVSRSLLYLTVLSFDGTMLPWLKTKQFSDPFIAGQRAICVVTGLAGTVLMPWLEKRLGLVRAGAWSIWSELLCLAPAIAAFYVPLQLTSRGPAWLEALLFGGRYNASIQQKLANIIFHRRCCFTHRSMGFRPLSAERAATVTRQSSETQQIVCGPPVPGTELRTNDEVFMTAWDCNLACKIWPTCSNSSLL